MVMLSNNTDVQSLKAHMAEHGVRISGTRWVFHLDVSKDDLERITAGINSYAPERKSA